MKAACTVWSGGKGGENQSLTYRYRGVLGARSRNSRLCHLFWQLSLELKEGRDAYSLVRGEVLISCPGLQNDLLFSSLCFCLSEALLPCTDTESIYESFVKLVSSLAGLQPETPDSVFGKSALFWGCRVMALILQQQGIAPELTQCVLCSSRKGIVSLSKEAGGYICRECRTGELRWSKTRLQLYRFLFKKEQPENLAELTDTSGWLREFIFLCEWYEFYTDRRLRSLRFLKEIIKLEGQSKAD